MIYIAENRAMINPWFSIIDKRNYKTTPIGGSETNNAHKARREQQRLQGGVSPGKLVFGKTHF